MSELTKGEAPREIRNVQIVDGSGEKVAVAILAPPAMDRARSLGILDTSKGWPRMKYDDAVAHGFYKDPPAMSVDWRKEAEYTRTHREPPMEIF